MAYGNPYAMALAQPKMGPQQYGMTSNLGFGGGMPGSVAGVPGSVVMDGGGSYGGYGQMGPATNDQYAASQRNDQYRQLAGSYLQQIGPPQYGAPSADGGGLRFGGGVPGSVVMDGGGYGGVGQMGPATNEQYRQSQATYDYGGSSPMTQEQYRQSIANQPAAHTFPAQNNTGYGTLTPSGSLGVGQAPKSIPGIGAPASYGQSGATYSSDPAGMAPGGSVGNGGQPMGPPPGMFTPPTQAGAPSAQPTYGQSVQSSAELARQQGIASHNGYDVSTPDGFNGFATQAQFGDNWKNDPNAMKFYQQGMDFSKQQTGMYPTPEQLGASAQAAHDARLQAKQGGAQGQMPMQGSVPNFGGGLGAYSPSPYLMSQIAGLRGQFDQGLAQNINGIDQQSVASGGLGGARQGFAQGKAIADSNTGFSNAALSLLGTDFNNSQNRSLSKYQGDQSTGLGYAGLGTQRDIAGMNNATQMHGIDTQAGLGYAGLNNALNIAGMNNATTRDLGFGQLGLGYTQAGNQFTLGQQQNQNTAQRNTNDYSIGQGNLGLGYMQAGNNLALGNRGLDLGFLNANNNNAIANRGLDLTGQGQMLNFYGGQRAQDFNELMGGASLYNMGQQGYWSPYQNYANMLSPFTGLNGGTTGTTQTGGGTTGAAGGAISMAAFGHQMGWW